MPISPADIQQKTFSEAKRGYQPAEVDVFLEEVAKDVDAMLRKIADLRTRLTAAETRNAELQTDVEKANAEVEAARAARTVQQVPAVSTSTSEKSSVYSATEEQLSAALIVAQQSADRIIADARAGADHIRTDAESQARKVIRQALDERQSELDEIERLKNSREQFRTEYMALIQKFADAANENFPLMSSTMPSGSETGDVISSAASETVIQTEANQYGAQIEVTSFDDLD